MNPAVAPRLVRLLLGEDRHQRVRASQTLLALGMFALFAIVQHLEVLMGLIDLDASNALTLFNLGCNLLFFLLIRSGLNLRLAPAEPSLTLPQCVAAVTGLVWSYAITGPARGSLLAMLILIILFGGLFQLRPAQARGLALWAFGLMAAVMAWRALGPGLRYDPRVELVHFTFTVIVLGSAAALSIRLGRLRARLSAQKAELAQALELNRELATRDSLTGLLNRRAMVELLVQERPRERRNEAVVSLALLDIDWFKRINDEHGHNVGDEVLQRFAALAREGLRGGDALARWGGEEFLLLMPGTPHAEAQATLERIRRRMADGGFEALSPGLKVTFSAGLATYGDGEQYAAAVERADRALYRAKQTGRDRVALA